MSLNKQLEAELVMAVAKKLARESQDTSLPVIDRLAALAALGRLFEHSHKPQLSTPKQPEYRWVQGARVKVNH
jgi:hypothetical protein